jgi:hypothetical protein
LYDDESCRNVGKNLIYGCGELTPSTGDANAVAIDLRTAANLNGRQRLRIDEVNA